MDWIVSASEWAKTVLQQAGTSPLALPLAFLLGMASAVASACCTLPVFGAIVGYAGMRESTDSSSNLHGACFFMIGTTVALLILGSVAGLIGQAAESVLGQYWKVFAGIMAIIVGIGALNLLPFKIPGEKERACGCSETRSTGRRDSWTHHGRRGKRVLTGLQSGYLHHPRSSSLAGVYTLDVRDSDSICHRLQSASGCTHVGYFFW